MTLVQRCAVATADTKLTGLIEKLTALRAEIDATLAELAIHTETSDTQATRLDTADALAGDGHVEQTAIEATDAETCNGRQEPVADTQSISRDIADDAPASRTALAPAPGSDAVHISVALFAREPVEVSLLSPVALSAAREQAIAQSLTASATLKDEAAGTVEGYSIANDDLTLVKWIDADLARRLNERGIRAFAQIAGWSEQDVKAISEALDLGRRVSKENWIEQAALLAAGATTAFAARRDAGATAQADAPSLIETPSAQPLQEPPAVEATASVPLVTPARPESAQIIAFEPAKRRAKDIAADSILQPHGRARRRVGALVLTTLAVSLLAGAVVASASGVFSEQARAAVSQSFRQLLDRNKATVPIDTSVLAPYMRPQTLQMPVPHASAEFDLLMRHRQSWPPGS